MNEENQDTTAPIPAVTAIPPPEQEVINLTDETHKDVLPDKWNKMLSKYHDTQYLKRTIQNQMQKITY